MAATLGEWGTIAPVVLVVVAEPLGLGACANKHRQTRHAAIGLGTPPYTLAPSAKAKMLISGGAGSVAYWVPAPEYPLYMSNSIFENLLNFCSRKMQMSHIYQPVMLMALLRNQGKASVRQIAKEFLGHDQSQIDYYIKITRRHPAKVLVKNHAVVAEEADGYRLIGFEFFSPEQIEILMDACHLRLEKFLAERGQTLYDHRRDIPHSIKTIAAPSEQAVTDGAGGARAGGAGEDGAGGADAYGAGGASAGEAGGADAYGAGEDGSNGAIGDGLRCGHSQQVAPGRDSPAQRDSGGGGAGGAGGRRKTGCVFCEIERGRIVAENNLAFAILDGFPVTGLHTLVIPKRHIASYFELEWTEISACNELLEQEKRRIEKVDSVVSGFNVGINVGEDAGQTVFHCHIHLIPRRKADTSSAQGGVRGVIPDKRIY